MYGNNRWQNRSATTEKSLRGRVLCNDGLELLDDVVDFVLAPPFVAGFEREPRRPLGHIKPAACDWQCGIKQWHGEKQRKRKKEEEEEEVEEEERKEEEKVRGKMAKKSQ